MRNIKITVEYEGTNYSGWQRQKNTRTVQEVIEDAILKITGEKTALHGSGRTDAGVHAIGQAANFRTESDIDTETLRKAFNSFLPPDIAVKSAEQVADDFHCRVSAKRKTYVYKILNSPFPSALSRNFRWFVPQPLNTVAMQTACSLVVGKKDFSVFAHADAKVKTTVRTVFRAELVRAGDSVTFTIEADGFLKRMVRLITGTLVQVGKEKLSVEGFEEIVKNGEKTPNVVAAPAQGLFLVRVEY